jgi:uncharacterized protein (UPF0332 family)
MSICNFEQFAINLFDNNKEVQDEALLRSCISRLYYGVYHRVLLWLTTCFNDVYGQFGGGSHEKLRFCCDDLARSKKDLAFKTISLKLKDLHDRRTRADYKLDQVHARIHVEQMLLEIQKFNVVISKLIQTHSPDFSAIRSI